MTGIATRFMTPADRRFWLELYAELYPGAEPAAMGREIDRILEAPERFAVRADLEGALAGFAEMSIRPFANGCVSKPVPFLEGIYVRKAMRRRGVGRALLEFCEVEMREKGFREIGSDVLLGNETGHAWHLGRGFEDTEKVVFMRKRLDP